MKVFIESYNHLRKLVHQSYFAHCFSLHTTHLSDYNVSTVMFKLHGLARKLLFLLKQ